MALWLQHAVVFGLHAMVVVVTGVLCGGFYVQFAQGEFPCPLCILERMAMILAMVGPVGVILAGLRQGEIEPALWARSWGMLILGALIGLVISARHVLLHIAPGDPGYGTPLFGLHLYTWALLVFVTLLAVSGVILLFAGPGAIVFSHRFRRLSRAVVVFFGIVVLANAVAVFFETGFSLFLSDTPTGYRLLE
ncbi:MAG: disulfide bond formation protein B [Myxococcota bacterium]|nr:disulfide bond formation protein B [Myxococcota bacterium]